MSGRHLTMLLGLGAIWGSSFSLLKVSLRELEPMPVIGLRIAIATLTLLVLVPWIGGRETLAGIRFRWRELALIGATNTAIPFFILTWGQQYLDTGVASIFNASAPLWTVLLALAFARSERVTGMRLLGFLLGFGGIVLLLGFEPSGADRAIAGSLAVCLAAVLYAVSALYISRRLKDIPASSVALGSLLWATLFTLPLGVAGLSGKSVGWETIVSLIGLGAGATALAYLLYFALIAGAGASRAILVTYLVPALAIVFGVAFLDETVTIQGLGGLALVLLGVALGTGTLRRARAAPTL
ncbi:MAG: DMT family transporter [Gemmatimonadota bacterium]